MPRAAFTYKTKDELRQMGLLELNAYIRVLRRRAVVLGGPARKSTEKHLAVAVKVRDQLSDNVLGAV